ncbi:serine/threonine protein phosphatase [Desulfurococcaceae archaeon MEX13E-LK6-19]|nr:serine/threonine protein phosphatase [Desulfurococcaceae archaeon MEX13E-LK6-19]
MNIKSTGDFVDKIRSVVTDSNEVINTIAMFVQKNRESTGFIERRFAQGVILRKGFKKLVVVGDLHGDFNSLLKILDREKVFEKINDMLLVFLGDYIDRGYMQLETILGVYLLKAMYPGNVVLLRGNHEPPPDLVPYPHDFPDVLFTKYGGEWRRVYKYFMMSFQKLPLFAILPGEIFFVHGGPPKTFLKARTYLEALGLTTPLPDDIIIEEILWSDPLEEKNVDYTLSYRGAGILYGRRIVEKALELTNTKVIMRAHEPVIGGFKIDHEGSVLTIFTSKVYGSGQVAYLVITGDSIDQSRIPFYVRRI